MNLILFGFKASGKTHFGKLLSQKLQRPFVDTDPLVIELYGRAAPISEIYQTLGEKAFRALEKKTLPILQGLQNTIISVGGGFVLDPDNVEKLKTLGELVYLKASLEKLAPRLLQNELPAILSSDDPKGSLIKLYRERAPLYESIQAHTIDTDALDEPAILSELLYILTTT